MPTAETAESTTPIIDVEPPTATNPTVGDPLALNLYLVQVSVREPTGESKIRDARVLTKDKAGQEIEVAKGKTTPPRHRWRIHPLWKEFEMNSRNLYGTLAIFSSSSPTEGMRQVPGVNLVKLDMALKKHIAERKALVDVYIDQLPTIQEQIRKEFPDHYEDIFKRLPSTTEAHDRFRVETYIWPLTPYSGEQLAKNIDAFEHLNEQDKLAFVASTNEQVQKLAGEQAQFIIDDVIGEMIEQCKKVESGALTTNHARSGTLAPYMQAVERMLNFGQLVTPEAKQHLLSVKEKLAGLSHQDINGKPIIQESLRKAFEPLGKSLEAIKSAHESAMKHGSGRASRGVKF
jgi:hypothetical protein